MKKNIFVILLVVLTSTVFGQEIEEPVHSIINIVRSNKFIGSACRSDITFPNQREFNLSLNSTVKYKIFSEGEIPVTVEVLCPASPHSPANSFSKQVLLTVERENEYYLFYDGGKFDQVEKEAVEKTMGRQKNIMTYQENLDLPINRSSLVDIAKKEKEGQGTCFLINANGYFITNFHCVENATEITIKGIDGDFTTKYMATIVASYPSNDLALIKIANRNVKFTDSPFTIKSTGVAQAERVYALGYPKAEVMGEEIKITDGIISSKSGAQGDISKFQISAAVNSGNSGGPLIDEEGNLIGVIYAKSTVAEAAGYAIKGSYLEAFLKNVDDFNYSGSTIPFHEMSLSEKVEILKNHIFIIEKK